MEKMLVTQALDERDLLAKRIVKQIEAAKFVDCKKKNEDKTLANMVTETEFKSNAESTYMKIQDLISRYFRLDSAIIKSNAERLIGTSLYGEISVATAIAIRSRIRDGKNNFDNMLAGKLKIEYAQALGNVSNANAKVEISANEMRMAIVGKDIKKDDASIAVIDNFIAENTTSLVDPIGAFEMADKITALMDQTLTEIETGIKISNATTMIEF